jgi:hypothetical protein
MFVDEIYILKVAQSNVALVVGLKTQFPCHESGQGDLKSCELGQATSRASVIE